MSAEPLDARQVRLAKNQALFRAVNERVEAISTQFGMPHTQYSFVCECSNTDCATQIELSHEEYEDVRGDPARFAIAPGHDIPLIEVVVSDNKRYAVVEKIESGREVAVATDPRGEAW